MPPESLAASRQLESPGDPPCCEVLCEHGRPAQERGQGRPPRGHRACRTEGAVGRAGRQAGLAERSGNTAAEAGGHGRPSAIPAGGNEQAGGRRSAVPQDRPHRRGGQTPGGQSPANPTQQSQGQPACKASTGAHPPVCDGAQTTEHVRKTGSGCEILLPLLRGVRELILLPHAGDAHVQVQPVDLL